VIETDVDAGFLGLGQSTARAMALRSAARGRLQRTLLVHGPSGAGKSAFVDDLLALLFCTDAAAEIRPCNQCRGCRQARAHTHPDLVIGSPQAWREARGSGESIVAAARRWLLESSGSPIAGERRVIVVEHVDEANEQAQNVLLKVLEEPGDRQMFILVADEPSRLLPTIRSRAQLLRIGPVPRGELVAWLMDRERLPEDQADALARIAGGLSGRATAFARNAELVAWRRRTQQELLELLGRGTADRFGSIRDLLDAAARVASAAPQPEDESISAGAQRGAAVLIIDAWLDLGRDLVVARAGRPEIAPSRELLSGVEVAAARISQAELLACMAKLERIRDGLLQNAAPKLAMEVAMLAWPSVDG
jgi:DNA polymerase III subunit delta'